MDNQLKEQEEKIEEQAEEIKSLQKTVEKLQSDVKSLLETMKSHGHNDVDGSVKLSESIRLKLGQQFALGHTALGEAKPVADRLLSGLITGTDTEGLDGSENSQLTVEFQKSTTGTTNQTFFYGFRPPLYIGDRGSVTSGGTTLSQSNFSWETNELDGAMVIVTNPSTPSQFDVYEIASNTSTVLTITGGTWTFTGNNADFTIFVPIYFGSAEFPWRRLYTGDTSAGGIRFGFGDTNGGQNGLLYNEAGVLKWRKPDGTVTTITVT